jgi:hypothetical protein
MLASAFFIVVITASTFMIIKREIIAGWEEKP